MLICSAYRGFSRLKRKWKRGENVRAGKGRKVNKYRITLERLIALPHHHHLYLIIIIIFIIIVVVVPVVVTSSSSVWSSWCHPLLQWALWKDFKDTGHQVDHAAGAAGKYAKWVLIPNAMMSGKRKRRKKRTRRRRWREKKSKTFYHRVTLATRNMWPSFPWPLPQHVESGQVSRRNIHHIATHPSHSLLTPLHVTLPSSRL